MTRIALEHGDSVQERQSAFSLAQGPGGDVHSSPAQSNKCRQPKRPDLGHVDVARYLYVSTTECSSRHQRAAS